MLADTGNVAVNIIDPPPQPVSIDTVKFTNINEGVVPIEIRWNVATDNDIIGYEILIGEDEHFDFIDVYLLQ
mgnify:FL=1